MPNGLMDHALRTPELHLGVQNKSPIHPQTDLAGTDCKSNGRILYVRTEARSQGSVSGCAGSPDEPFGAMREPAEHPAEEADEQNHTQDDHAIEADRVGNQ
jgi:hypothetical protein